MRYPRLFVLVCSLFAACATFAADAVRSFNVPAGDAADTLRRFAQQAGREIVYPAEDVRGQQTNAVRGELPVADALAKLLAGTRLAATTDAKTQAISVTVAPAESPKGPAAPRTEPALARPAADSAREDTIVMTPFTVATEKDEGFVAAASLAGGRLSTSLKDTPVAYSVLTRDFLDVLALNDTEQAMTWSVGSYLPIVALSAYRYNDNEGGSSIMSRGLQTNATQRNFFLLGLNADTYSQERIDYARGPNALLIGTSGLGGVVNGLTKRARTDKAFNTYGVQFGSWNKHRLTLDFNHPITEKAALRANLLWQDADTWRDLEFDRRKGAHVAATFKPFRRTQIRAEYEYYLQSTIMGRETMSESISGWDGTTTVPLAIDAIANSDAKGIARLGSSTSPQPRYIPGMDPGVVMNWANTWNTMGGAANAAVPVGGKLAALHRQPQRQRRPDDRQLLRRQHAFPPRRVRLALPPAHARDRHPAESPHARIRFPRDRALRRAPAGRAPVLRGRRHARAHRQTRRDRRLAHGQRHHRHQRHAPHRRAEPQLQAGLQRGARVHVLLPLQDPRGPRRHRARVRRHQVRLLPRQCHRRRAPRAHGPQCRHQRDEPQPRHPPPLRRRQLHLPLLLEQPHVKPLPYPGSVSYVDPIARTSTTYSVSKVTDLRSIGTLRASDTAFRYAQAALNTKFFNNRLNLIGGARRDSVVAQNYTGNGNTNNTLADYPADWDGHTIYYRPIGPKDYFNLKYQAKDAAGNITGNGAFLDAAARPRDAAFRPLPQYAKDRFRDDYSAPEVDVKATTYSYGGVFHLTRWASVYANYAESFRPPGAGITITGAGSPRLHRRRLGRRPPLHAPRRPHQRLSRQIPRQANRRRLRQHRQHPQIRQHRRRQPRRRPEPQRPQQPRPHPALHTSPSISPTHRTAATKSTSSPT
jgi:hypothetical protein